MDDEHIIEQIDFSEFETLFQARFKAKEAKTKVSAKPKKVELFDSKRTRGISKLCHDYFINFSTYLHANECVSYLIFILLVFAKRRVRKEPEVISELIACTDLDGLITEHCELLLQIVPKESEVYKLLL